MILQFSVKTLKCFLTYIPSILFQTDRSFDQVREDEGSQPRRRPQVQKVHVHPPMRRERRLGAGPVHGRVGAVLVRRQGGQTSQGHHDEGHSSVLGQEISHDAACQHDR